MKFIKVTDVSNREQIINTAYIITILKNTSSTSAGNSMIQLTSGVVQTDLTLEDLTKAVTE